jgi:NAD(P)-dependent dehydrogenase (short-subunit alcohol dehydrogenase family)
MMDPSLNSFPDGGLAVVVGGSGGIGSALVQGLKKSGRFADVVAASRTGPERLNILEKTSVAAGAARIRNQPEDLRLVIDTTGFLHDQQYRPEKRLADIDPDHFAKAFAVNATGPALLLKHFLPLLPRHGKCVVVSLSARVGSIGDNRLGGWFAYRASKAALNQIVRTASVELARSRPEAICVALHPGTVDTALSGPFSRTGLAVQTPAAASGRLLAVIESLSAVSSGGFFDHKGEPVPW